MGWAPPRGAGRCPFAERRFRCDRSCWSNPAMNPVDQFAQERRDRLAGYAQDAAFQTLSRDSLLALLDMSDAIEAGTTMDPRASRRKVLGVDIDIRAHNRAAIEAHPMASRIAMVQGSAVAPEVVQQVRDFAQGYQRVLVCLDSMHTHDHVLGELNAYAPLVTPGSYCVVFDTFVEDMPPKFFADRPWDVGNNPKTAVHQWLADHPEFEIDAEMEQRLQVTVAPHGFLRRKG